MLEELSEASFHGFIVLGVGVLGMYVNLGDDGKPAEFLTLNSASNKRSACIE